MVERNCFNTYNNIKRLAEAVTKAPTISLSNVITFHLFIFPFRLLMSVRRHFLALLLTSWVLGKLSNHSECFPFWKSIIRDMCLMEQLWRFVSWPTIYVNFWPWFLACVGTWHVLFSFLPPFTLRNSCYPPKNSRLLGNSLLPHPQGYGPGNSAADPACSQAPAT